MASDRDIARLVEIMAALRTPVTGCPWDLGQTWSSRAPFAIEEAYEVADAARRGDRVDLRDELGDLLLQVAFFARLAEEEGAFDFGDVVEAIVRKLVRRHPHVFGDRRDLSPDGVKAQWEAIKREEKAERAAARRAAGLPDDAAEKGALAGVAHALPALIRAEKLQSRAGDVGFDWADASLVLAKLREETAEVEAAIAAGAPSEMEEEVGDLLFVVANLARHLKVDPEAALRAANARFERRFAYIEAALARQGRRPEDSTLTEMDALWDEAKAKARKTAA